MSFFSIFMNQGLQKKFIHKFFLLISAGCFQIETKLDQVQSLLTKQFEILKTDEINLNLINILVSN